MYESASEDDAPLIIYQYFQSWRYFSNMHKEIKWLFQFREDIHKEAAEEIDSIRGGLYISGGKPTLVGIHVRRGDKLTEEMFDFGYRLPNSTCIVQAMDYFKRRYSDAHFLVISQDMDWCVHHLNNRNIWFPSRQHVAAVDLAMLTLCDHVIVTEGTFGWWGGFLGGGEVLYYGQPAANGSELDKMLNETDYFPPEWKPYCL